MLIDLLKEKWWNRVLNAKLEEKSITINIGTLKPSEAIGRPKKWVFPLMTGREVMIEARIGDACGQAFTDQPAEFTGSIKDVMELELKSNRERAILIAAINATYRYLGLIGGTKHCRNEGPEKCAIKIASTLKELHGNAKIGLIGYQPAILHYLTLNFEYVRATDMNLENIGKIVNGVEIEPHTSNLDVIRWSDIILATGTTIVNNTIDEIIEASKNKKLYFYGVTIAAAAYEFKLNRLCFESS